MRKTIMRAFLGAALGLGGCTAPNPATSSDPARPPAAVYRDAGKGDTPDPSPSPTPSPSPDAPDMGGAPSSPDLACVGGPIECDPGAEQQTADGCEVKGCGADCQWTPWGLAPGAACVTGTVQSCNAGVNCAHAGTQKCNGCQWGPCNC